MKHKVSQGSEMTHKLAFLSDICNFKARSRFCSRWEDLESQMKILKKGSFWQHPYLKMVWSKKFCTLDIFEEQNS